MLINLKQQLVVLRDSFTFKVKSNQYLRKLARKLFRHHHGYYLSQLLFGSRPAVVIFLAKMLLMVISFTVFALILPALMFDLCDSITDGSKRVEICTKGKTL